MTALLPYFELPALRLGPVVLHPWSLLVVVGMAVGFEIARARRHRCGIG